MASTYYSKPKVSAFSAIPIRTDSCQYTLYTPGEPRRFCNAPTNGRTYCEACRNASMARAPKFHGGLRTNRSEAA